MARLGCVFLVCAAWSCNLGCCEEACDVQVVDGESPAALSLLQTNARRVVRGVMAPAIPDEVRPDDVVSRDLRHIAKHISLKPFLPSDAAYAWTSVAMWLCLLVSVAFLVLYEIGVASGSCDFTVLFDQKLACQWQYYTYGFCKYAQFSICIPMSGPLSTALGYNAAMSGLLITIEPAMEVFGVEIARRMVKPWNQALMVKWLAGCRSASTAFQVVWVWVLLCPDFLPHKNLMFWTLVMSRAFLGLSIGSCDTCSTMMAVKFTPNEETIRMTSYSASTKRFGLAFGTIFSSVALQTVDLTPANSTVYQMSAVPVILTAAINIMATMVMAVTVTRNDPSPQPEAAPFEASPSPEPEAAPFEALRSQSQPIASGEQPMDDFTYQKRRAVVINCVAYNFTRQLVCESIDLAAAMIFGAYLITIVEIGYLIGFINLAAAFWLLFFTGSWGMKPAGMTVMYNMIAVFFGVFVFNFGPWWLVFSACCGVATMTSAANGIANGLGTNAGIPRTYWSQENFSANRAQATAAGRFLSGPLSRGIIAWSGRDGFAVFMMTFLGLCLLCAVNVYLNSTDPLASAESEKK